MTGSGRPTETALWLDPCFGVSGDMLLGVLTGLGASLDQITAALQGLSIPDWNVTQRTTTRCSLSATQVTVSTTDTTQHRSWSSIDGLLAGAALDLFVADGARRTFRLLAEAEAAIHGVSIDAVHFHEVGAVDAIVDILGSWVGYSNLRTAHNIVQVTTGPVGLGRGTVPAAHGTLPLPAPATASLLRGVPVQSLDATGESVTPTGAALLVSMTDSWGPIPSGVLLQNSRGAGSRDPEHYPNVISGYLLDLNRPD